MKQYGQKKLNQKDVSRGIRNFILSFLLLTAVTFSAVFFLFKSSAAQGDNIVKEMDDYRNIVERNRMLTAKLAEIETNMELVGSENIANSEALQDRLLLSIKECKAVIGADSASAFKHYSILLEDMNAMMNQKALLLNLSSNESNAKRDYENCVGKVEKIQKALSPPVAAQPLTTQ